MEKLTDLQNFKITHGSPDGEQGTREKDFCSSQVQARKENFSYILRSKQKAVEWAGVFGVPPVFEKFFYFLVALTSEMRYIDYCETE